MDHICDSINFVATGIDDRLHDGRRHSYPAGRCRRCDAGPGYSGPKTSVRIRPLAGQGEVFGKEVVNKPEDFIESTNPLVEKVL